LLEIKLREHPRVLQLATASEGYIGLWVKRMFGLPFVVWAHGNEILYALQTEWTKPRRAMMEAERILANSHYTAGLVEKVGVARERIEVIHPGCDLDTFRPVSLNEGLRRRLLAGRVGTPVIVTVGNLVERKGHDMVLRALPRVAREIPGVTYLIVGDGPNRASLEALAVEAGVRDRVVFAGQVPRDELPDVYALSDVFVMPSRARLDHADVEGFGMVFLEASACGKPVIGGHSGGISEAVVDGQTGFLVDPSDEGHIASRILEVLSDKTLATSLGDQGRRRVVASFGWEDVVGRLQTTLDSVCGCDPRARDRLRT
jgi:phosphatidylinositol alpha-1,6-mannosyltransferase